MPKESYKCWQCSNEELLSFEPRERSFCSNECRKIFNEEKRKIVKEYTELKRKVMFETALRTMEKAKLFMHEYKDASDKVCKMENEDVGKFMSSHEVIAAIILTDFNYEFEPNFKIGKYRVDFYIPELKVCVEIDGHLHKNNLEYDNSRDIDLRHELGKEWEIVRIGTKLLEETPDKFVDEIEYIKAKKQKLRVKNNGIIPEYFSEREAVHYKTIVGEKEKKVWIR